MPQSEPKYAFAAELFKRFPMFDHDKCLYLDFEGTGSVETALNLFWPMAVRSSRFRLLLPPRGELSLSPSELDRALEQWGLDPRHLPYVVVFSGSADVGTSLTQCTLKEEERLWNWAGRNMFPSANWVSMWVVLRRCSAMKDSIRDHGWVRSTKKSSAEYSQEALEWEFGLQRPERIRSHSKMYAHPRSGETGCFSPLSALQDVQLRGSKVALEKVMEYCRWDVEALFQIASICTSLVHRR